MVLGLVGCATPEPYFGDASVAETERAVVRFDKWLVVYAVDGKQIRNPMGLYTRELTFGPGEHRLMIRYYEHHQGGGVTAAARATEVAIEVRKGKCYRMRAQSNADAIHYRIEEVEPQKTTPDSRPD